MAPADTKGVARFVSLCSAVFVVHIAVTTVAYGGVTLDADVNPVRATGLAAVSINAAAHVTRGRAGGLSLSSDSAKPDQQHTRAVRLMSSRAQQELHSKQASTNEDARTLELMQQRRAAQEEEAAQEFESAFDGKWINMVGMTATQSTTEHDGTAGRAVDGNANTAWTGQSCTHTKYEWKPWWEVDMKTSYHISAVKVTNRGDCCGEQCEICSPLQILVDESVCHADVGLVHGQTKVVGCPFVGDSVRIALNVEDYLMLCEVKVKAVRQSLLEKGASQCTKHSLVAQPVVTPNATDGLCKAGSRAPGPAPVGFRELEVGRSVVPGGPLRSTAEECEGHLLTSDDDVEGAVWHVTPESRGTTTPRIGSCRLLVGSKVTGVEPAVGARCWRKLRCPHDMRPWLARAGIGRSGTVKGPVLTPTPYSGTARAASSLADES